MHETPVEEDSTSYRTRKAGFQKSIEKMNSGLRETFQRNFQLEAGKLDLKIRLMLRYVVK